MAALEKLLKHFSRKGHDIFITGPTCTSSTAWAAPTALNDEHLIPDCPNGLGNLIVIMSQPAEPNMRTACTTWWWGNSTTSLASGAW